MADTTITIPSGVDRAGWTYDVSSELASLSAGESIIFKDADGNEYNMPFIQCSSDATIITRAKDLAGNLKKAHYFVKGGWHQHWYSAIYKSGTTASAGIIARAE
jgi:hypothetical protein